MAENAKDSFSSALTLFSGIYQDMAASDLPEGLSPDNQDQWPLPGSTGTRPALNRLLGYPFAGTPTILSVDDLPAPSGDFWMMSLDSLGNQRWNPLVAPPIVTSVLPGVQCKAEAAFDKQFCAYFNGTIAGAFSEDPFVGVDAPRYIDPTSGTVYRVTSDAPGVPPAVVDDPYPTFVIAAATAGLVITGVGVDFNSLSVDGQVCTATALNGFAITSGAPGAPVQVGDTVLISSSTPAGYEGTFVVTEVFGNNGGGYPTGVKFNNIAAVGLAPASAGTILFPGLQITTTLATPYTPFQYVNVSGSTNAAFDGQYQVRAIDATSKIICCGIAPSLYALVSTPSGGGVVQQVGSIVAGPRNAVVLFNINGCITAPSEPVNLNLAGGGRVNVTAIPLGPPGTTQRIIAFTQAYGSLYFYLTPAIVPSIDGLPAVVSQGTVINDNISTSGVFDFSDVQLATGTNISAPGNNLFNQIVLAPCLGVIEYQERLFWWGEINNIKNFNAGLGFESGYSGALASAIPKGWATTGTTAGTGGLVAGLTGQGYAYKMVSAGGAKDCLITQGAFQDYYGAPIVEPSTTYIFRIAAQMTGAAAGNLICDIYSPGSGVLATATIAASEIATAGYTYQVATFNAALPAVIPADTVIRIYLDGVTNTGIVIIDEGALIDSAQPVLNNQLRASYFANPFGYDEITGVLGLNTNDSMTAAFRQRDYLYLLTDNRRFVTQNNGVTEPNGWTVSEQEEDCGCAGPCAVDSTEGVAFWVGRYGRRVFVGGAQSKLVSLEVNSYMKQINWAAGLSCWVTCDPVERIVHFGLPLGEGAGTPTADIPLSYRAVDAVYNVPDPIRQSFQGRMLALELCRKSTIWFRNLNCAAMVTRPLPAESGYGNAPILVLGGGNGQAPGSGVGYGNLYYLNFAKYTDDDYGIIGGGTGNYYFTYGWWSHEKEESIPLLGLYRKLYAYLALHVTGVGQITITPYVDDLNHPWIPVSAVWDAALGYWVPGATQNPLPSYVLSQNIDHDLEWALNVTGNRVFFKIQVTPLAGQTDAAFVLSHMIVSGRMENVFPVRGSVL